LKTANDKKNNSLELAVKQIKSDYGDGSIMKLGDKSLKDIPSISSGSIHLNAALGVGGFPKGRIVEIYGPESSGKTTIALHVIAEVQKNGGTAAFIDAEHALDPKYARNLGVDVNDLLISQPDYGEQALSIADVLVRSGAVDIIVVDSVAALVPQSEIEGEMGDSFVGLQARLMSQALRKLAGNLSKSNTLMIFINQIREKVNTFGYGPSETTSGGRALKFYASVRLDIRRIGSIKQGEDIIGNQVKVKVTKNKVAPPFKEASIDIIYGKGISRAGEIIDLALKKDILVKSGSWFSLGDEKLGQGKESIRKLLDEDNTLYNKIVKALSSDKTSNDKNKE
jgi:recombination protein RecA